MFSDACSLKISRATTRLAPLGREITHVSRKAIVVADHCLTRALSAGKTYTECGEFLRTFQNVKIFPLRYVRLDTTNTKLFVNYRARLR
jgi:methyl coenzyme M reductase subunit D